MRKFLVTLAILVITTIMLIAISGVAVLAVSGVDNFQAYESALQSIAQTTVSAIGEGWTGTANTLDKGLEKVYKVFEKAIAP